MKKVQLLTCVLCILSLTMLKAQPDQGKFLIGMSSSLSFAGNGSTLMSLEFSTSKVKSDASGFIEADPYKMTSFNLLPKVGYFVIDNLALGLDISMALSNSSYSSSTYKSTTNNTVLGVGPFVRYYIPTAKVLPFFEIGGSFGKVNSKNEYGSNTIETKSGFSAVGGGVGVAVPLGELVTFDALLDYRSITTKDKENNPNNERTVNGTLGLKLGFTILLGGNGNKEMD